MDAPLITIFVRHSPGCKYAGDEFTKRCQCKKHLRWSQNGKQRRMKTGARSWAGAEDAKRAVEAQLAGRATAQPAQAVLLQAAIETFEANKRVQGIDADSVAKYKRELKRLRDLSESRGAFTVAQALTVDNLIALRATWMSCYVSSYSRSVAQKRINHFAHFCHNAGWIDRFPKLPPIKVDVPKTEPLTDAEYNRVLEAAAMPRTRTVIKLMRWSGLAVRDAGTLQRSHLSFDDEKGIYRIIRERTKTGAPLYIPIPKDVAEEVRAVLNGNPVYVFWNRQGESSERWPGKYLSGEISAAFDKAGVESKGHMVSHRLRATFAVDLLQKGLPLEHVSKLLGHKSVTTTEKHYARWVKGRQDRLDALVAATWKK